MRRIIFCLIFFLASCLMPLDALPDKVDDTEIDPVEVLLFDAHSEPRNELEIEQLEMIQKMAEDYPGVTVNVLWRDCGMVNAFYNGSDQTITMCHEIEDIGQGSVMAAAHEMAHAIQRQLADYTTESDADELGALEMLKYGKHQGVIDQVKWFDEMKRKHSEGDPHPSSYYRAFTLACMELGSRGEGGSVCTEFYNAIKTKWYMRLKMP